MKVQFLVAGVQKGGTTTRHRLLAATFESEIRDLEPMLGWDLSEWLADPPAPAGFSQPRR
jgi:hypothetical protein